MNQEIESNHKAINGLIERQKLDAMRIRDLEIVLERSELDFKDKIKLYNLESYKFMEYLTDIAGLLGIKWWNGEFPILEVLEEIRKLIVIEYEFKAKE